MTLFICFYEEFYVNNNNKLYFYKVKEFLFIFYGFSRRLLLNWVTLSNISKDFYEKAFHSLQIYSLA